jgi:hypothetical protein
MSRRKPAASTAGLPLAPLRPGSISFQLLELIAKKVAHSLGTKQTAAKSPDVTDVCAAPKLSPKSRHNK